MRASASVGFIAAVQFAAAAALAAPTAGGGTEFAPPATPLGITLQLKSGQTRALNGAGMYKSGAGARYFADADGWTLYVRAGDGGNLNCDESCRAAWPPAIAAAGAKPVADWAIVAGPGGIKQWAYKGRPLFRSEKDKVPGDTNGPTEGGWTLAMFDPAANLARPAGISVTVRISTTNGPALTDAQGLTLYTFDGDVTPQKSNCVAACLVSWRPVVAAELAKPVGEWSLVRRNDGTKQWAYRGKPLYTFVGDFKVGDANGEADKRWHAALLSSYFSPAEVKIGRTPKGWAVLTTAEGRTLYARDKYRFSYGGYAINDGPPPTADVGRSIGTAGCSGDCLQGWIPLAAPAGAQSAAHWTVVAREDGSRQWAYQGYPLYAHIHDKKPGDTIGSDIFNFSDGTHALYWRIATP